LLSIVAIPALLEHIRAYVDFIAARAAQKFRRSSSGHGVERRVL